MMSCIDPCKGFFICYTTGILSYAGPVIIQIILETYTKATYTPCSCCPVKFRGKLS